MITIHYIYCLFNYNFKYIKFYLNILPFLYKYLTFYFLIFLKINKNLTLKYYF